MTLDSNSWTALGVVATSVATGGSVWAKMRSGKNSGRNQEIKNAVDGFDSLVERLELQVARQDDQLTRQTVQLEDLTIANKVLLNENHALRTEMSALRTEMAMFRSLLVKLGYDSHSLELGLLASLPTTTTTTTVVTTTDPDGTVNVLPLPDLTEG